MTLGQRIRAAREAKNLSQDQVAAEFGITREAVSLWESDATRPKSSRLKQLADFLGVSVESLLIGGSTVVPAPPAGNLIPVRGFVQAGVWAETHELPPDEWIWQDSRDAYNQYRQVTGLLVRGDSMDRVFPAGSMLYVCPMADYPAPLESGDYVIACRRCTMDMWEWTVKEYRVIDGETWLRPHSTNPRYQNIRLPNGHGPAVTMEDGRTVESVEIWGVVVGRHIPSKPKFLG